MWQDLSVYGVLPLAICLKSTEGQEGLIFSSDSEKVFDSVDHIFCSQFSGDLDLVLVSFNGSKPYHAGRRAVS